MNLLFNVDQAAALKLGINAPQSRVQIDIDPAVLMQAERDFLAVAMRDGHDCTKDGGLVAPQRHLYHSGDQRYQRPLVLVRPDLQGVRDAIALRYEQYSTRMAELETEAAAKVADSDAKIDAAIAAPSTKRIKASLASGLPAEAYDYYSGISVKIDVPTIYACTDYASPEAKARYAAEQQARSAEAARIIAATKPELERLHAEAAAADAAERAEYDALYARLPETLRQRSTDGFASTDEVRRELRKLLRADAGYPAYAGWKKSVTLTDLSNAEYQRLIVIRSASPEGATVTPTLVWDVSYRPAEEDEEGDDDGEVAIKANERRIALIEWTRAGIDVRAALPLRE